MSPASSGTLEVERYIGAYLISQNRSKCNNNSANKNRDQYYNGEQYVPDIFPGGYVNLDGRYCIQRCHSVDAWAGGMPLISFANNQRRCRRLEPQDATVNGQRMDEPHNPLARLAVHTQGAPLILTKSFNHRKNKFSRNNISTQKTTENKKSVNKYVDTQNNVPGVDAISVTSDESSGSTNSENCLPRIIKPRKRRKKDRKPPLLGRPLSQDGFSTDSASPDIDPPTDVIALHRSFVPFTFDPYRFSSVSDSSTLSHLKSQKKLHSRYQIFNDISETPKLHHSFDDIEEVEDIKDINGNQPTSICQCRYCDPAGQIWDVDRSCYSPFLTPPNSFGSGAFHFPNLNIDNYTAPISSSENYNIVHSMSSVSLEEEVCDKNVIEKKNQHASCDLEVSTEIVTSLNGHRDIEIKFFSALSVDGVRVSNDEECDLKSNNCAVNNECKFISEE